MAAVRGRESSRLARHGWPWAGVWACSPWSSGCWFVLEEYQAFPSLMLIRAVASESAPREQGSPSVEVRDFQVC